MGAVVFNKQYRLHLKDSSDDDITKTALELKKAGIKKVIAGHCTGAKACGILKETFKSDFTKLKTGDEYSL